MKIYALEITSECNLNCSYCPQPTMQRKKEHLSMDLYKHALQYPYWHDIIIGHLFGEAFLHPDLEEMIQLAERKKLAFGFSSNMRDFDLHYFNKLLTLGLSWLVISYHIPEAKKWYQKLRQLYPEFPILSNALEEKHSWSGQIDTHKKANIKKNVLASNPEEHTDCIFHRYNLVSISSQGDIYACCLDAEGLSNQGSILDISVQEFSQKKNNIWFDLCHLCPLRYNETTLQQYNEQQKQYAEQIIHYKTDVTTKKILKHIVTANLRRDSR